MRKEYDVYKHHGKYVKVRSDLRGEHREHCLCYDCHWFDPENRHANCHIANRIFRTCEETGVVTPVWECPQFEPVEYEDAEEPETAGEAMAEAVGEIAGIIEQAVEDMISDLFAIPEPEMDSEPDSEDPDLKIDDVLNLLDTLTAQQPLFMRMTMV